MPIPVLIETNPGNGSTGIPVGSSIVLSFDRSLDVSSVQDFVVLFGADYDQTSGPDSAMWIDKDTGNNPFFLRSPGFKGLVELQYRFAFYDLDTDEDISTTAFYSYADESTYGVSGVGQRVYITPTQGQLAPDLQYTLHILGDPDDLGTGISSRTVYDVEPDSGNAGTSGVVVATGGYIRGIEDVIHVEITTSGDIGAARYKWWLESEGEVAAVREKLTNRRFRALRSDLGVQLRFTGDAFQVGDTYTIVCMPPERLASNTKVVFTTNDGSYSLPPDSPSVPAESEPPEHAIPPLPGSTSSDDYLQVEEMLPADGSFNVKKSTNQITILFSEALNAGTVTQDTVRIYRMPALGWFEGEREPREMSKKITVSGQLLTLDIG